MESNHIRVVYRDGSGIDKVVEYDKKETRTVEENYFCRGKYYYRKYE